MSDCPYMWTKVFKFFIFYFILFFFKFVSFGPLAVFVPGSIKCKRFQGPQVLRLKLLIHLLKVFKQIKQLFSVRSYIKGSP